MTHHLVGMAEIAEMLGVSRQRVSQLVTSYEDFPAPEAELAGGRVWSRTAIETWIASHPDRGPGHRGEEGAQPFAPEQGSLFERYGPDARTAIVRAQEQARLLLHHYIGTEHLLLGLLTEDESTSARVLAELGVTLEQARELVVDMVGQGGEDPPIGRIPFTQRAANVFKAALGEAMGLGHTDVREAHILLALISEHDGIAWKVLERMGLDATVVKSAVLTELIRRLPRATARVELTSQMEQSQQAGEVGIKCSFCGKKHQQVEKVIAGPGVYICNECIDLCNEILADERAAAGAPTLEALAARVAELSERLAELEKDD